MANKVFRSDIELHGGVDFVKNSAISPDISTLHYVDGDRLLRGESVVVDDTYIKKVLIAIANHQHVAGDYYDLFTFNAMESARFRCSINAATPGVAINKYYEFSTSYNNDINSSYFGGQHRDNWFFLSCFAKSSRGVISSFVLNNWDIACKVINGTVAFRLICKQDNIITSIGWPDSTWIIELKLDYNAKSSLGTGEINVLNGVGNEAVPTLTLPNLYNGDDYSFVKGMKIGYYNEQLINEGIISSGNVGIGTPIPSAKLDVLGNVRFQSLSANAGDVEVILVDDQGYLNKQSQNPSLWTEITNAIHRNTGKVLIGQTTSADTAKVQITDAGERISIGQSLFSGNTLPAASIQASGHMTFGALLGNLYNYGTNHIWQITNSGEKMRLSSQGHLLLGTPLTGFNTKLVVVPNAVAESTALFYLNNNRTEAFVIKRGNDSLFLIKTGGTHDQVSIGKIDATQQHFIVNIPQIQYEETDVHGQRNDFSVTGVPEGEIYERRNAAHFRNGSGGGLTHLSITTDAVNNSSARFIIHIEGQASDNPIDVKLIVNQSNYSVIEYSNNAKPAGMTFSAFLDTNNNIVVQAISSTFVFSCLTIHMRKHSRFNSVNPIPRVIGIVANDGSSTI